MVVVTIKKEKKKKKKGALVLLFWTSLSYCATLRVTPGTNWCHVVNGASPGDRVLLLSGNHPNACRITVSGTAEQRIVVEGGAGAKLMYPGSTQNIVEATGSFLTFLNLDFPPLAPVYLE